MRDKWEQWEQWGNSFQSEISGDLLEIILLYEFLFPVFPQPIPI
jgi:hypothetical protein